MEDKIVKPKRKLRGLRIFINSVLLIFSVIVIMQNDKSVSIDFLWTTFNLSLPMLILLTGSLGSLMTLVILLFKK